MADRAQTVLWLSADTHDGVAPDEWVAYEYAIVRHLYADLGISDQTEIEFFNSGHEINGEGTFKFLHRHLTEGSSYKNK